MEIETAVGLVSRAITIDNAIFRAVLTANRYGFSAEIDVAVALAGVDTVRNYNRIAVISGIDTSLNGCVFTGDVQVISQTSAAEGPIAQ